MLLARAFDHRIDSIGQAYGALLGLLLFVWLVTGALILVLVAVAFAPGHAGLGDALVQLNDLLPANAALWSGFAP